MLIVFCVLLIVRKKKEKYLMNNACHTYTTRDIENLKNKFCHFSMSKETEFFVNLCNILPIEISEIMIKNQGLPTQESLFQLYLFFCQERGVHKSAVINDLEMCAANYRAHREKQFDDERKRRIHLMNNK